MPSLVLLVCSALLQLTLLPASVSAPVQGSVASLGADPALKPALEPVLNRALMVTVGIAPGRRADLLIALAVLHDWDARRARAWAGGDQRVLRSLYLPGAEAGRADLRLFRAYAQQGLLVRRLVTQIFTAEVLVCNSTRIRMRVLERVAGGTVDQTGAPEPVGDEPTRALPSSDPVRSTIELRRSEATWRVASVSGSGRDPRGALPSHRGPSG